MITDIDRHNDDRAAPNPNKHDQLMHEAVMARGTNSTNYTTASTNDSLIAQGKNGQFTIVQTGSWTSTAQAVLSSPGAGNFGNNFTTLYYQPHNLSFTPGIMGYIQTGGFSLSLPYSNYGAPASNQAFWATYDFYVDNTYVYITLNVTGFGTAVSIGSGLVFKWYLLLQTSN